MGRPARRLTNVSTAFALQNKNGEMWSAADLHLLHGDLLQSGGNQVQAQSSYRDPSKQRETPGATGSRAQTRLAELTVELSARALQYRALHDEPGV